MQKRLARLVFSPAFQTAASCLLCIFLTFSLALGMRMLELPAWNNPEFRLGDEYLLATHDAYHWLSGAVGYGRAVGHPMALMLEFLAWAFNISPANAAFWLPAVFASFAACAVYLWGCLLGLKKAGIAAGLICCLAPGFLGRTLLGYYDTDIITLLFPLLMGLAPACWIKRFSSRNAFHDEISEVPSAPIAKESIWSGRSGWLWALFLMSAGLFSAWTVQWHSVFPYLLRCNVIIFVMLILFMAPKGQKKPQLMASCFYGLPALAGSGGLLAAFVLFLCANNKYLRPHLYNPWIIAAILLALGVLICSGQMFEIFARQLNAYLKRGGDLHASGVASLVFPSVAQSIIEVQDLSIAALFPYFHPWLEASILGFAGFALFLFRRPALLFLLPLAVLALSSAKLGGRMVMFGAPITALGAALIMFWIVGLIFRRKNCDLREWLVFCLLSILLLAPFLDMIPALSQGPSINRRHAAALAQAREITPPDSMLWIWWDWGYAAHYFARRSTIADGAEHGGPSLYLPAAVFAADNPRFARQVMRRVSEKGIGAANFFRDMDARAAQDLINSLHSANSPLVKGSGRQFIIVSFEMLKLGFWISNYGNWNFMTQQGEGGAISIIPQAVGYRLEAGEVRLYGSPNIIFPASICVFGETGLKKKNYIQAWFDAHRHASPQQQKDFLASRRNINFLFNLVTDEKIAVDEGLFNSLMIQLLVADPGSLRLSPYFKLVYDNVFARIYEALPQE